MEIVGHHGPNGPFKRSNDPRSRYGANWSPQPKWTIYKVKRSMEQSQLVTTAKTAHLQGQTIPGASKTLILLILVYYSPRDFMVTRNSDVIFSIRLHGSPLRTQLWNQLVTTAKMVHLQVQMIPEADLSYGASWSPRVKQPIYKVKQSSEQLLSQLVTMAKKAHLQGQTIPRAGKPLILLILVNYSLRDFMLTWNSDVIFAKNLDGLSLRPLLWSKLVTTAKTVHLQGQTNPGAGKPPICQFSCAIVHGILW
ncbi:hypothetical protein H5410_029307 [Solanum commersonii]|uniref:Uncharacterized protein n=1 Tax=Solanum commersonii TaxID=4109 RepID=A0A9J5Z7D2_SOLCO|nr:hypothetical protein H5410_029307 [Solanum commersonii]